MFKKALLLLPCLFAIVLAGWYPEEQVTNGRYYSDLRWNNGHKVVVAANGVRHLVWNRGGVCYKRWYPTSGWTSDYPLDPKAKYSAHPSIALDSNGTDIHVVWQNTAARGKCHIYYQKCVPGSSGNGGWVGTPRDLTPNWGESFRYVFPSVACYQNHIVVTGICHSNWGQDSIVFCECVNGNWSSPVYFEYPFGVHPWKASIAVDAQNRYADVFISWLEMDISRIYVMRRTGGTWQAWEDAMDASGGEASIEVDPVTGYPHVVDDGASIWHTYWDPNLGWRPMERISDLNTVSVERPSMFFCGGTAFVVWAETNSDNIPGIRYSTGNYGNWATPAWVTSGYSDGNPSVAARSNGDVYVVWDGARGGRFPQIWGRLYTPGSFDVGEPAQATNEGSMENEVKEDLYNLTIAPNPAINQTTIRYNLPVAGPVNLKLYNATGREIRVLAQGTHEPGLYTINLNAHILAQGVYYLKYELGNYRDIKKLIVQR